MNHLENKHKIDSKYVLITILSVGTSWFIHEFAHWGTGELLGNAMAMSLNTCYPENGKFIEEWHSLLVSAAGPVVTLMQALLFYILMSATSNLFLFPFLLTPLYMRFLAGIMNFINLNDEGRISKHFELGTFTLPLFVSAILFFFVYQTVKRKRFRIKLIVATILIIMVVSSIVILVDNAQHVIIL